MIGSCPPGYENRDVKSKCKKEVLDQDYTYHLDLPVGSNATGKVYVNIFCAICNGELKNIMVQKVNLFCDNQDLIDNCKIDIEKR